jgi:hypothetical protein
LYYLFITKTRAVAVGGGTSPYEAMLEQKRAALRRVLKREFLLRSEKPFPGGKAEPGAIFDAAIQRWGAVKATRHQFYYPTVKNLFTPLSQYLCSSAAISTSRTR